MAGRRRDIGGTRAGASHRVSGLARQVRGRCAPRRAPICSSCPASGPSHSGSSASRPRGIGFLSRRSPSAAYRTGFVQGSTATLRLATRRHLRGLADAIIACLEDPQTHARLCDGAARIAAEFDFEQHMEALMHVLNDVARSGVDVSKMVRVDGRP